MCNPFPPFGCPSWHLEGTDGGYTPAGGTSIGTRAREEEGYGQVSGLPASAGGLDLPQTGGVWATVDGEYDGRPSPDGLSACGTSAVSHPFHHITPLSYSFGCMGEGQSNRWEEEEEAEEQAATPNSLLEKGKCCILLHLGLESQPPIRYLKKENAARLGVQGLRVSEEQEEEEEKAEDHTTTLNSLLEKGKCRLFGRLGVERLRVGEGRGGDLGEDHKPKFATRKR